MSRRSLITVPFCVSLALGACADDTGPPTVGDSAVEITKDPTSERAGPLPDNSAGSCVESYSPVTLAHRGFAFDGVVLTMGSSVTDQGDESDLELPSVTFQVRKW